MSVFNFAETHLFLRHYISELPRRGRGEASRIAKHLGVSTTLVSQVLAGQKFFTAEQTHSLSAFLGLSAIEADYLMMMVQFERAGSVDLKNFWQTKMKDLRERALKLVNRVKPSRVLSEGERAIFYSSPIYSAIRLYTSTNPRGCSIDHICERFKITRAKAAEVLNFLVECGLCVVRNERFFLGSQSTHLEHGSPFLPRHHANWRLRALQVSEDLSDSELMYTAPVSLSREDFKILREEMAVFIKKFLDRVHASASEDVACLNMDFFWIK